MMVHHHTLDLSLVFSTDTNGVQRCATMSEDSIQLDYKQLQVCPESTRIAWNATGVCRGPLTVELYELSRTDSNPCNIELEGRNNSLEWELQDWETVHFSTTPYSLLKLRRGTCTDFHFRPFIGGQCVPLYSVVYLADKYRKQNTGDLHFTRRNSIHS